MASDPVFAGDSSWLPSGLVVIVVTGCSSVSKAVLLKFEITRAIAVSDSYPHYCAL